VTLPFGQYKLLSANYEHRFEFPIKEFVYGLFRTGARKEELLALEVDELIGRQVNGL
jgi:hypothetical protein